MHAAFQKGFAKSAARMTGVLKTIATLGAVGAGAAGGVSLLQKKPEIVQHFAPPELSPAMEGQMDDLRRQFPYNREGL